MQQFSIKQTLKAVKSVAQVAIVVNKPLWSRSIQLCEEFVSSFFYAGAWKRDWKIFLTIVYRVYVGSLEKFHEYNNNGVLVLEI